MTKLNEKVQTNVTLTMTRSETDDLTGNTISYQSSTYNASSMDELARLLKLAGLDTDAHSCGCQEADDKAVVVVDVPGVFESYEKDFPPGFFDDDEDSDETFELDVEEDFVDEDYLETREKVLDGTGDDLNDDELEEDSDEYYDYGHRDYGDSMEYDLTAFAHDTGRAGHPVRYVPARSGDNPLKSAMKEIVIRLEESISTLLENDSDEFLSALKKVRHRVYESLNKAEISHLAAAFINLMQDQDETKVKTLHGIFRDYLGEAAMEDSYRSFKRNRR